MADRSHALRVLALLKQTALGDTPVLVGSSGLFGFETAVPALTEDIDLAVPERLVAAHEADILADLDALGLVHPEGSATFVDPRDGASFDLIGHGDVTRGDHIGGGQRLRVMVFEDLSRVLDDPRAVSRLADGRALTPAGFVAAKLLTERAHKGAKDKIQALLVLAERADDGVFLRDLRALLEPFDAERRDDATADAQGAFLALSNDPSFRDAGAEGYAGVLGAAERGLAMLLELVDA